MADQFYALLVGIDRYDNPAQVSHLRGCVNDAFGTYAWLVERMGFPKENILLLTARMDQQEDAAQRATRANILAGWQAHLAKAGPGDQVFFGYSGHGSQARSIDANNASGYDETIVPCDSRTLGVFDILDQELAQLIEAVERKGAQVTVLLDCCHSGSGTRMAPPAGENAPLVRKGSRDERKRPADSVLSGTIAGTRSGKATSGWISLGNHLLLAGCRDEELSHEYQSPETGEWQGTTTYFFHKAMANYTPELTWASVYDYVQTHVNKVYPRQSPQLEGPSNLRIFGGLGKPVSGYLLVTDVDSEFFVKVNGGVTAGLARGADVVLYPPNSDLSGRPIAGGMVETVKVDHAWVRLEPPAAVELASRAKVSSYSAETQTLRVSLGDERLKQAVSAAESSFLQVLSHQDTNHLTPAYQVNVENERYVVRDGSGEQVVDETPAADCDGAAQVVNMLEHLAIYTNILTFQNASRTSSMNGAIVIESLSTYTQMAANREPKDPTLLQTSESGHQAILTSGERLFFKVRNTTNQQLYLALFELLPDLSINLIFPRRAAYQRVGAGKEIPIDRKQIHLANPQQNEGKVVYKVVASKEPVNFTVLTMPALNKEHGRNSTRASGRSSLGKLLNAVRLDGTRGLRLSTEGTDDQWTTAQVTVTLRAT